MALLDGRHRFTAEWAAAALRRWCDMNGASPDRDLLPLSVVSSRVGRELALRWATSDDADARFTGMFCLFVLELAKHDHR